MTRPGTPQNHGDVRRGERTGANHPAWLDPLVDACTSGDFDGLLPRRTPPEGDEEGVRDSAVLVLFSGDPTATGPRPPADAEVLLTHRAATLRSHSGQLSFPGGGVDEGDTGPASTALREAREETGLEPDEVDVLAVLPDLFIPVSRYRVAPVLGYWREPGHVDVVDRGETSRVMTVPLDVLLDPANRFLLRFSGGSWTGPAFQLGDLVLWGFTAGILAAMFSAAGWDLEWDTADVRELERTLAESANGEPAFRGVAEVEAQDRAERGEAR